MAYPFRQIAHFSTPSTALLGAALLLLTGCGGGGGNDDTPVAPPRSIAVEFQGQVNGQDFVCGATYDNVGVGTPGTYKTTDFRFYVHDVALVTADGGREPVTLTQDGVWQYQNVAMLDLRNNCGSGPLPYNADVTGTVPDRDYTGICFKVGIPYELNHISDATAPPPLNSSGMLWNWRGGRKFIRMDGVGDPGNLNVSFVIHLGSTECPGTDPSAPPTATCGYPNIAEFCLDGFDVDHDRIVMDVGKALAEANVTVNTADTAPGCMSANSDPECITIMPRLNLDFTFTAGADVPPESYPKVTPEVLFSVGKP